MWPFSTSYATVGLHELHDEYDYVIVGGGTAGCVLANRLSANPENRVLLLERGHVGDSWLSRVPLFSANFAQGNPYSRHMQSTVQAVGDRPYDIYQGSGLGGTTRINHLLYTRGQPLREWINRENKGFFYSSFQHCVDACRTLGLPHIPDINDPAYVPVGWARLPITRDANGHRHSTMRAFLPPGLLQGRRSNLHVCPNVIADRIEFDEEKDHLIARSVSIIATDAKGAHQSPVHVRVCREVVLSAGTFGSPQILMLSGIGPAKHLHDMGIAVLKDLPVGENLQDHFGVFLQYFVPLHDSILRASRQPLYFIMEFLRYLLFGTGVLLCPVVQIAIFACTALLDNRGIPVNEENPGQDVIPDIEIMPVAYAKSVDQKEQTRGGFTLLAILLNPESKGTVRLASTDPRADPRVDLNYLAAPADRARIRHAVRLTTRISECLSSQGYELERVEAPPGDVDDATLDKHISEQGCTTYHYTSTCAMGSVLGHDLIVRGTRNLRVADASAFPEVPAAHLQAPVVVFAEKCADMMLHKGR
ncbi:alcohol oxidase [Melanogaster broomeanus]|nr:alcohol oxidase [Melanogaster broomeanus]